MHNTKLITVIIPTFNRVELLKKAYDSCKAQSSYEFDLIITDNASSDGTKEYLLEIEKQGLITNLLISNQNDGPLISLANALSHVKTKWVTILCDDDFFEPDFIESLLPILQETSKALIIVGFRTINQEGTETSCFMPSSELIETNSAVTQMLEGKIQTAGISSFIVTNDYIERNPLKDYPKGFLSDTMLMIGAALEGGCEAINKCLYNRLIWDGAESAVSVKNMKLYFSALLLFGSDFEVLSAEYNLYESTKKAISSPQSLWAFFKIIIMPSLVNTTLKYQDVMDFWHIASNQDKRYRLHVLLLYLFLPFLTHGSLQIRKYLYSKLRAIKRAQPHKLRRKINA